ncbi:unnamed protein product [Ilex paraguariensis]|uniref:Uncharacterized protein n=1 Tax=Ilex paraguariensis TaxID=185542 RepID=A0ABC8S2F0_9AQUA
MKTTQHKAENGQLMLQVLKSDWACAQRALSEASSGAVIPILRLMKELPETWPRPVACVGQMTVERAGVR